MPSTFGWVDFIEEDRRRMLDLVHLFREQDTRDELGLGTIRDAFADHFFPGTSTVQTRVRYMLFVPWMYLRLEQKKTPSAQIARKARNSETGLISELLKREPEDGVIGSEAGKALKRLPSNIYWSGLGAWGIRLFQGSQDDYHRHLDAFYALQSSTSLYSGEADDEFHDSKGRPNWHPGLPELPKSFPENATLALTREEAVYLRDRILTIHGNTLLAALLRKKKQYKAFFPWEHPIVPGLPARLQQDLEHAHYFSEVMHGASLLYNLLLSRKRQNQAWIHKYETLLAKWTGRIEAIKKDLNYWQAHIEELWKSPALMPAGISLPTRHFVETWLSFVLVSPGPQKLPDYAPAEQAISERERALKRTRARLENHRAMQLWKGRSGTQQLSFRWPVASTFVEDILRGLREGKSDA